jgi:hypothetical protein
MDRRTFIKRVFQVAGCAGLIRMGLINEANARGIFPAVLNTAGRGSGSWANWDELQESGLLLDQNFDGVEDTNIVFMESGAGTNELSKGVLSGIDLVYTQAGGIAGAIGSPPYRTFDKVDDTMTVTPTWGTGLFCQSTGWLFLTKLKYNDHENGAYIFYHAGGDDIIALNSPGAATTIQIQVRVNGANALLATTAGSMVVGTTYYIAAWATGALVRAGFTTTRPTKWSDFPAAQRVSGAGDGRFTVGDLGGTPIFMSDGGGNCTGGDVYYVISSQVPSSFINDVA